MWISARYIQCTSKTSVFYRSKLYHVIGVLLEAAEYCEGSQNNTPNKRILLSGNTTDPIVKIVRSNSQSSQTTTGDDIRDFAKQLKNKITRKYRHQPPKKTYLDYAIKTTDAYDEDRDTGESLVFNNIHTRINNLAERLAAILQVMTKFHPPSVVSSPYFYIHIMFM